jgi:hypothetical protein
MSIEPDKTPRPGPIDDTLLYDPTTGKYFYGAHPEIEAPPPRRGRPATRRKSRKRRRRY